MHEAPSQLKDGKWSLLYTYIPAGVLLDVQCVKVCALLDEEHREALLEGLEYGQLSMADIQSLLHWANFRSASITCAPASTFATCTL